MDESHALVVSSVVSGVVAVAGVVGTLLGAHLERRAARGRQREEREARRAEAEAQRQAGRDRAQREILLELQQRIIAFRHTVEAIRTHKRPEPIREAEAMRALARRIRDDGLRSEVDGFLEAMMGTWQEVIYALDHRPGARTLGRINAEEMLGRYRAVQEEIGRHLRALE